MPKVIDRFISWLYTRRIYGSRCPEYEPECIVCEQWKQHDELFENDRKSCV